jgi:phosphatidate cytidylyltransferase
MLKQRLLTAMLLAPLVVFAVLYASLPWLAGILGVFVLIGAWEWSALSGCKSLAQRGGYTALVAALMGLAYWQLQLGVYWLLLACGFWGLALSWVQHYQQGRNLLPTSSLGRGLSGLAVLLPGWVALLLLQQGHGSAWLLFLLALIWVADSGAYFAGRRWGKRKLADQVSPGKTWAGAGGALVAALTLTLIFARWQQWSGPSTGWLLGLVAFTVAVSILGDLLESLFKRVAAIKDSGRLLPGHGGVLDRIDSLTAAAPIFVLGLRALEDAL